MKVRKSLLSGTWYPGDSEDVTEILKKWAEGVQPDEKLHSAVVPHAGWYYSGRITAKCLKAAASDRELVIIAGGHLPPGSDILAATEESFEIPGGTVKNATDFLDKLKEEIRIREDHSPDNTVEVILPAATYFSPEARIVWLRVPSDNSSIAVSGIINEIVKSSGINAVVIGSTDLTHYGNNYYFTPAGKGAEALKWVRNVNDAGIIELMKEMKAEEVLKHAMKNSSACSAGAAAAAVTYAQVNGAKKGRLVEYATSYDTQPAESFVGYAGIVF